MAPPHAQTTVLHTGRRKGDTASRALSATTPSTLNLGPHRSAISKTSSHHGPEDRQKAKRRQPAFACFFFLLFPNDCPKGSCSAIGFKEISRLKEHIQRVHPEEFKKHNVSDELPGKPDKNKTNGESYKREGVPESSKWYDLFCTYFPGRPPPPSPYNLLPIDKDAFCGHLLSTLSAELRLSASHSIEPSTLCEIPLKTAVYRAFDRLEDQNLPAESRHGCDNYRRLRNEWLAKIGNDASEDTTPDDGHQNKEDAAEERGHSGDAPMHYLATSTINPHGHPIQGPQTHYPEPVSNLGGPYMHSHMDIQQLNGAQMSNPAESHHHSPSSSISLTASLSSGMPGLTAGTRTVGQSSVTPSPLMEAGRAVYQQQSRQHLQQQASLHGRVGIQQQLQYISSPVGTIVPTKDRGTTGNDFMLPNSFYYSAITPNEQSHSTPHQPGPHQDQLTLPSEQYGQTPSYTGQPTDIIGGQMLSPISQHTQVGDALGDLREWPGAFPVMGPQASGQGNIDPGFGHLVMEPVSSCTRQNAGPRGYSTSGGIGGIGR